MSYLNAHTHTHYSNIRMLDCIIKEDKLIDYCLEMGLAGVAITDHETVGSYIKALTYMESLKKKAKQTLEREDATEEEKAKAEATLDFKLCLGNEIYLCRDGLAKDNYVKDEDKYFHFILIAKDKIGNDQIRELSSRAWSRSYYQFIERVPTYYSDLEEIIGENPGHVIGSIACLGGQFAHFLSSGDFKKAENFAAWCESVFGKENFFLEFQPGEDPDQIKFNKLLYIFNEGYDYRTIITTDAHYLKAEDRNVHKAFLNSNEGDRETDKFYATTYIMSEEEIFSRLDYLPKEYVRECLDNTLEIKNLVEDYSLAHKQIIPRVPLDFKSLGALKCNYKEYPNIEKFFESPYEDDNYFIASIWKSAQEKGLLDAAHLARIDEECEEILIVSDKIEERLSAYFVTLAKIIDIGWNEGDTLIGPWRGSAGGSLCAYLIGITQRDPLRSPTPLPFWRFISRGRVELADIDIDSQASKRERFIGAIRAYFESIGGELTSVATFGTETSKAALVTAARGLGYEPELGTYLSSLVPIDRGHVRELEKCYFGDEEKEWSPVSTFVKEMNFYPDIWEVARGIEGLISRRGVHASGIILTNDKFTNLGATMKSPKGVKCSQWELHDEEYAGHIKFDMLTVDALDRIRTTMELLLDYGYLEWQGNLKDTYFKYLGPDSINYEDKEMWRLVGENKIISLFQFDTPQGLQTAKLIKPESLLELAQANSLMRLMPEAGKETPAEEFVKYKRFPYLLEKEISSLNAREEEKKVLLEFMKEFGGVLDSQESLMRATMLPFTNYSVDEANVVRKVVAKKKLKQVALEREKYIKKGLERGTSEDILRYIWDVQAARQMGYSFSIIHTIAYSILAIQELNLAYFYPRIFWNTACLIVDSGGLEEVEEGLETGDELEEEDKVKKTSKALDYGKISTAINKMKQFGVNVSPPDVNKSTFTFKPEEETNTILYGLKGISRINTEYVNSIIDNRPFASFDEFLSKVKSTKLQVINLIKSGAFDSIEPDRKNLMMKYVLSIAETKKKLTLQNMPSLIKYDIIPEKHSSVVKVYNFNKFLKKECKSGENYILDDYSQSFFNNHFDCDYLSFDEDGNCVISQKQMDKLYKRKMEDIREFLKDPATLESLNSAIVDEIWSKYCFGNLAKWEMDSIGFYNKGHELINFDFEDYPIVNYFDLPEEPTVEKTFASKEGKPIIMYSLSAIAGTVIGKNKLKNTVTLLTENGVVSVKVYKSQFAKYDKQKYDKDEETGKKTVTEKSWFTRGNKLIFIGLRRGDTWIPKKYKSSPWAAPIILIDNLDYETGEYTLTQGRDD